MSDNAPVLSTPPRPSGRTERNRLLIWLAITFFLPAPFVFALMHFGFKPSGAVFSVKSELVVKFVTAFFAVLATLIVSRMEKRPLADYGIPPRQVFGIRFWEGCVWGFAMLSLILLIIRTLGHFQIDSVALTGGAVYRYALGW